MKKLFVSLLTLALFPQTSWSADGDVFTALSAEGVTIRFQVISESAKTCRVYRDYSGGPSAEPPVDASYTGTLTIPSEANGYSVIYIAAGSFAGSNITEVILPEGMIYIGDNSTGAQQADYFSYSAITTVKLPSTTQTIGYRAFEFCENLSSLIIPDGVECIESDAFTNDTKLTTITIPSTVLRIGSRVFDRCDNLTSVIFDNCYPTFRYIDDPHYSWSNEVTVSAANIYYPACAHTHYQTALSENAISGNLIPQIHIGTEWATYCATASFDVPDGIEAYVVKSYSDGMVTLKKVTTINEGQGVLLKPASIGTFYDASLCASTPDAYESNLLKGVTSATDITTTNGEYTNFIFTKVDDEIGFYPASAGTIPAYKAYLQIPTASLPANAPARLSIVFESDETTSVESVRRNTETGNGWYTLQGQRIAKPNVQGVYIHEGKKVIIK